MEIVSLVLALFFLLFLGIACRRIDILEERMNTYRRTLDITAQAIGDIEGRILQLEKSHAMSVRWRG